MVLDSPAVHLGPFQYRDRLRRFFSLSYRSGFLIPDRFRRCSLDPVDRFLQEPVGLGCPHLRLDHYPCSRRQDPTAGFQLVPAALAPVVAALALAGSVRLAFARQYSGRLR